MTRIMRRGRRAVRRYPLTAALSATGLVIVVAAHMYTHSRPTTVNREAYQPLLAVIAKGESNGNYNAYFGNAENTTLRFTDMTIAEVLQWQADYVGQGNPSGAVGKYQIIRPTLMGLVRQLGMDMQTRYDESTQDRLALALLERRGLIAYVEKDLTREQFATNLAREWAALPRVTGINPQESYYAGDGLNKTRVSVDELFTALVALETSVAAHRIE